MDGDSVYSVTLAKTLGSLGINQEWLQLRKSKFLKLELLNIFNEVSNPHYITGSIIEGTTIYLMHSDVDRMNIVTFISIINNREEWRSTQNMLLLTNRGVHPGYVKLISLESQPEGFRYDSFGNMCFSSEFCMQVHNRTNIDQTHGPALTRTYPIIKGEQIVSVDKIVALRCSCWPRQASEWSTRTRHNNWPPRALLKKAKTGGCLLVPVGFTGSLDADIEWRLSFSLLERELVWSWNDTQRQCLVFLKLMLKNYIDKKCPDVLSSYHLKTLMFWMVEETPWNEWVPANLTKCIMVVLHKLLQCVQEGNCPSYFIRENNLFDGKLQCPAKSMVTESITKLIDMGVEHCLQNQATTGFVVENVIVDKIRMTLGYIPHMPDRKARLLQRNLFETITDANHYTCVSIFEIGKKLLDYIMDENLDTIIDKLEHCIVDGQRFLEHANEEDREAMQLVLNDIHSSLGSHLFVKALQTQDVQTNEQHMSYALSELELGQHFDIVSGKLKLATMHYINRDYHKVLDITDNALRTYGPNTIFCDFIINSHSRITDLAKINDFHQLNISATKLVGKHYAFEVLFLPTEEPAVPREMKYECVVRNTPLTAHIPYVAADPIMYAHFLHCASYFHAKQADKCLDALKTFHGYVKLDYKRISLKPTALNLLAHCCFMAGKYTSGLKMLVKSISICPDSSESGAPRILSVRVFNALKNM